jgi:acyl carrier protein
MDERLLKCFRVVFPNHGDAELVQATTETLAAWDSVAAITLVNVVEEEFGVQMDYEVVPELTSFEAVRSYLSSIHA